MMDSNKTPTLGGDPRLQFKMPSSDKNPYVLLGYGNGNGNSNLSTLIDSVSRKSSSKFETDMQYSCELFLYSKLQAFQISLCLETSNEFVTDSSPSELNQIYYPNIVINAQTSNTNCKTDNIQQINEIITSKITTKYNDNLKIDSELEYKEESLSEAFCSSLDD